MFAVDIQLGFGLPMLLDFPFQGSMLLTQRRPHGAKIAHQFAQDVLTGCRQGGVVFSLRQLRSCQGQAAQRTMDDELHQQSQCHRCQQQQRHHGEAGVDDFRALFSQVGG
jgi:hypothetical protein